MRCTIDYVLCYDGSDLWLHGYTDTNYTDDLDKRKLTFAYTFLLGEATSWCNKKQLVVVLSTMEAEYVASSAVA